ncbi:zinc ribbon domain-containing protein [Anaerocolumna cellulosilytica]|uniref:zinc ribbon domain-containing protein n=1 Tax=Anaerocolumna cellulosilytica TaxID=433286 RepID=UPI0016191144|nr:zinc ribbon domain-containing protein [Anaerocolumna cellulosilytica]MBB5197080.1 hypothetical protein [Anaerocolumna cellulosilytica]
MFFIMGISSGEKKINFVQTFVCNVCGQFGRYEVFMTYTCLSLFFIPVLRWNKQYYIKSSCCSTIYSIEKELGKRIQRGEPVTLLESDLTIAYTGNNRFSSKQCPTCGRISDPEDSFCSKCGSCL